MRRIPILLLLAVCAAAAGAEPGTPAADSKREVQTRYQSSKPMAALQKCLVDKLTARGDVTAVPIGNSVSLMYRENSGAPMIIDLEPPAVTITTKVAFGTRKIVEGCL